MRLTAFWLLASLLANGVLAGFHLLKDRAPESPAATSLSASAADPQAGPAAVEPAPETWQNLIDGSGADFIARLRREGFPPDVVRQIVGAQLNQRYAERRKAFEPPPVPYWKDRHGKKYIDPELIPARRALEQEYLSELRVLLGEDATPVLDVMERQQFGDLPPDKVGLIKQINNDYTEMAAALREATKGVTLPEDERKLAFLEQEKRADLAAVLSPEELLKYELRSSDTARGLRNQLHAFEPSEEEFVALFHVQREVERALAALPHKPTADESRELRENLVKGALSPERFDDYQIRTAGAYREVSELVTNLALPEATTREVIRTQREVVRQANEIRNDRELNAADRQTQLATLSADARQKLEARLGKEGLKQYLFRSSGRWLGELPPPKPPIE